MQLTQDTNSQTLHNSLKTHTTKRHIHVYDTNNKLISGQIQTNIILKTFNIENTFI